MKTLSQLIEEAEERLDEWQLAKHVVTHDKVANLPIHNSFLKKNISIKDFLKTELETIVKESFKNTRVEEDRAIYGGVLNSSEGDRQRKWGQQEGFNQALSDKHNKENQFLNN